MASHLHTPRIRRVLSILTILAALVALSLSSAVPAFANVAGSDFESGDANLTVNTAGNTDWNSFSPVTWTGTAPFQTAAKTLANGWAFAGFTDAQATPSDSGFKGGTKQDDNCAGVIGTKAPNKDDLKRIYLASNLIGGHVYLTLAWVRISQNTTSSSAHVGFEFNQGSTPCPAGSGGLVQRTPGDMLIVYDFSGGTAAPTITIRRWVTSGTCEISSDSPPCWGPASTNLITAGFAEAAVDTAPFPSPVQDTVAPSTEQLGDSEFGEAGVDLTAAGVFPANQCLSFGQAEGVSRSSGNSGTAAMEDLVGPGKFTIANCGQIIIRKQTVPSPDPTNTTFSYTTTGGLTPASFTLKDGGVQNYGSAVQAGSYSVKESDPGPNFVLTGLDCSASSLSHGSSVTTDKTTGTVSIVLKALDAVDCTYTNTLQQGAIKITKTSSKAAATPLAGAVFTIKDSHGTQVNGSPVTTGSDGTACVDHLLFGTYSVQETAAPTGYAIDNPNAVSVTVDHNATCTSGTPNAPAAFTDTPLTDILAMASSEAPGGTQSTVICTDANGNVIASSGSTPTDPATASKNGLPPGTYTCTIVIDP